MFQFETFKNLLHDHLVFGNNPKVLCKFHNENIKVILKTAIWVLSNYMTRTYDVWAVNLTKMCSKAHMIRLISKSD